MHIDLTAEQRIYAVKLSQQIGKNFRKGDREQSPGTDTKELNERLASHSSYVGRKYNFVECPMCNGIYRSMTSHLKNKHKLSEEAIKRENDGAKTIPAVYTKMRNGRPVKLTGAELEVRINIMPVDVAIMLISS